MGAPGCCDAVDWDEQITLVLALQRCQLAGCQQGQAQLLHGQSSHLRYRPLQDGLWDISDGWLDGADTGGLGEVPTMLHSPS